jgi:hypothetical protein
MGQWLGGKIGLQFVVPVDGVKGEIFDKKKRPII